MWSYTLIWMGPINYQWTVENGKHWSAGRIDCHCTDPGENDENLERSLAVPLINHETWGKLWECLRELRTASCLTIEEIKQRFFSENNGEEWIEFNHES